MGQFGKAAAELSSSSISFASPVERVVQAAVRRKLLVAIVEQAGWALSILLVGVALLLLLGFNTLGQGGLILFAFAGLITAAFRLRRCLLPDYRVAQILDRRLHLQDAISTAYYLRSNPQLTMAEPVHYQLKQADQVALTVQPQASFPFTGRTAWLTACGLAAASLGLFAVRYLVTESLNVRPPLVSLQLAPIIERIREVLDPKPDARKLLASSDQPPSPAATADGETTKDGAHLEGEPPPSPAAAGLTSDPTETASQMANRAEKGGPEGQPDGTVPNQPGAQQKGQRDPGNATPQAGSGTQGEKGSPQAQTKEQPPGIRNDSTSGSPGLVSRMKEALSNIVAKMQPGSKQQAQPGGQQSNDAKASEQAQTSGRPQNGNQSQQQRSQDQSSNPGESAEGQAQGQTAEKLASSQGKSSDQSAQKGSNAHSGVGQQDGDKDIKNAEQLKAMGKLADIIGKRSASLTGEMTVETSSGKQQLKTNYSHRQGQHSDLGGEINRNEVPLIYQQYVREYMEQVRKPQKATP